MSGKRLELFSALFAGMVAYVCATPYFYTKAIKFGVEMAGGEVKEDEKTTFHLPKKKKEPVMSEDEKRNAQILANIDRYDGTPFGQVEIKREHD